MSTISIPLKGGNHTLIDADDKHLIAPYDWFEIDGHVYAAHGSTILAMHRVIMDAPADKVVDHINRDGLDNRRENLRLATHWQNCWNRGLGANNTSGYKGVFQETSTGKWRACIRVYGEREYLGTFTTKEAAARAYDGAARHYAGAFAYLNFPDERNGYVPKMQTSRYRGVSRMRDKWEACLTVNKTKVYRERFEDEEEAARAYDQAARLHLGDRARLNFPEAVAAATVPPQKAAA